MSNVLEQLGSVIKNLGAPLLGAVMGGQFGVIGGTILDVVMKTFGNPQSPEDLITKIQADPDAATKLQMVESNNRVELERIASQNAKAVIDDVQNARELQEDKLKGGYKDPMYIIVGLAVIFGFLSSLAACFLVKIDPSIENVIFYMLGTLNTAFLAVVFFYFGSSASSARKDNILFKGVK